MRGEAKPLAVDLQFASANNLQGWGALLILPRFPDPIVQWPRTPPFHGGNTGSNPVRVATKFPG